MPPQRKKRTTEDEATEERQLSMVEPIESSGTNKEMKLKRIEDNLRARELKKRAEQGTLNEAPQPMDTQDDPSSKSEDELALALKQLEKLKREKERFTQELQAQRQAADKLAKLNEAKR
ncbi:uncharacterized protein LOC101782931 [Setaria italica]|uniref:uncharacterized protein LOC101782931 n=1 Tax=Setaria italica TaxID=4555 RepID=UPI0003511B5A|nr:uncharacterized protein LOC101782931 [Setaria italica]